MGHLRQSYSVGKGGGGRQGKKGGEGIYERGFRREEETRRSTKGDRMEGTGDWIHYQELQIWLLVQTTCVSADYRNFSEFYLSG